MYLANNHESLVFELGSYIKDIFRSASFDSDFQNSTIFIDFLFLAPEYWLKSSMYASYILCGYALYDFFHKIPALLLFQLLYVDKL